VSYDRQLKEDGVHIAVIPGTSAEAAGFHTDDVLLEFRGTEIKQFDDLVHVVLALAATPRAPYTAVVMRDGERITLQYVTIGIVPWSTATIGAIEALRDDDAERNRLTPVVGFTGHIDDVLGAAHAGMTGIAARSAEPDIAAWNGRCRLDPARAATGRTEDPEIAAGFDSVVANFGRAMHNLSTKVTTTV